MHQTHINFLVTIFCFLWKACFKQVANSQKSSGKMCCYEYIRLQSWALYQTILLGGVFMCLVHWHEILKPTQNRPYFVGTFCSYIFSNENIWITNNPFVNRLWLKTWLVAINKWPTPASYGVTIINISGKNDHIITWWLCHLTSIGIPIIKIRQYHDHLILIMGIPMHGKTIFILQQNPDFFCSGPSMSYTSHLHSAIQAGNWSGTAVTTHCTCDIIFCYSPKLTGVEWAVV